MRKPRKGEEEAPEIRPEFISQMPVIAAMLVTNAKDLDDAAEAAFELLEDCEELLQDQGYES